MTSKELQFIFDKFNKRFFEGRIPDTTVKFGDIKADGLFRYSGEIIIQKDLKKHNDLAILVLLHEMVHADLRANGYVGHEHNDGHGTQFHVGIDRLYKIGAYDDLL